MIAPGRIPKPDATPTVPPSSASCVNIPLHMTKETLLPNKKDYSILLRHRLASSEFEDDFVTGLWSFLSRDVVLQQWVNEVKDEETKINSKRTRIINFLAICTCICCPCWLTYYNYWRTSINELQADINKRLPILVEAYVSEVIGNKYQDRLITLKLNSNTVLSGTGEQ